VKPIKVNFNRSGFQKLPKTSGVYISGCGKEIGYIGSSGNIQQRVKQQINNGLDGCHIKVIPTRTRKQAYDLERTLIGKTCPPQNRLKPGKCKTSLWDQLFG